MSETEHWYELPLEAMQDMDNYYIEKDMIRNDLKGYIALKKETVKANCIKAKETPIGIVDLDFNYMLGDTIKEKYESLVLDCVKISRQLRMDHSDRMCDAYWICGSPEFTSIFETSYDFDLTEYEYEHTLNYLGHIRVLNSIWHILKNTSTIEPHSAISDKCVVVDPSRFYVGCGNKCILVKFNNFII